MSVSTKERIEQLGEKLLLTVGYNGFSYHDISKALGIKNAAIHYHFPKKEQLGIEIIANARERFRKSLESLASLGCSYPEQLTRFIKGAYDIHLKQPIELCEVGAVTSHFNTVPFGVKEHIQLMAEDIRSWLIELLHAGRNSNQLCYEGSPEDRATLIISTMVGALQIARIMGIQQYFKIKDQLIADLTV